MENDIILDSIADGVFTVNDNWRITSFNRAAEQITGVRREEAIGQHFKDVLKADVCEKGCILRKTIQSGKSIVNRIVHIVDAGGVTFRSAFLRLFSRMWFVSTTSYGPMVHARLGIAQANSGRLVSLLRRSWSMPSADRYRWEKRLGAPCGGSSCLSFVVVFYWIEEVADGAYSFG